MNKQENNITFNKKTLTYSEIFEYDKNKKFYDFIIDDINDDSYEISSCSTIALDENKKELYPFTCLVSPCVINNGYKIHIVIKHLSMNNKEFIHPYFKVVCIFTKTETQLINSNQIIFEK